MYVIGPSLQIDASRNRLTSNGRSCPTRFTSFPFPHCGWHFKPPGCSEKTLIRRGSCLRWAEIEPRFFRRLRCRWARSRYVPRIGDYLPGGVESRIRRIVRRICASESMLPGLLARIEYGRLLQRRLRELRCSGFRVEFPSASVTSLQVSQGRNRSYGRISVGT